MFLSRKKIKENKTVGKNKKNNYLSVHTDCNEGYYSLWNLNSRSTYNWLGTARDRKQYDHSRNGPVVASSWYGLKSELNGIGQCTPLTGKGHPVTFNDLQQIRYITPRP